MTFDALLDDTFLLATGKSRSSAKRSRRYKTLCADDLHVPYASSNDVAEMLLLGELIADRAFATMPARLRRLAATWQTAGHDGQVAILREVKRVLGDESLDQRNNERNSRFKVKESLPHQYGSWGRGKLRPNCLGMVQMLIGFARATGAPHMMIDSIRSPTTDVEEFRYRAFRDLLTTIEPYSHDRSINKIAKLASKHCDKTLKFLAAESLAVQSHVLLSIRTDNEWWILDPYLDVCTKDNYVQNRVDRAYEAVIAKHPRATATITSYNRTATNNVQHHLGTLKEYINYLDKFDQPRTEWSFTEKGLELIYYSLQGYNKPSEHDQFVFNLRIRDLALQSIYPAHVYDRMLDDESSPLKINDDFDDHIVNQLRSVDQRKRIRDQTFRRAVLAVIYSTYNRIFEVNVGPDIPPPVREYLHPTMQLAVRTMNQLAVQRQIDIPQLIKFGSSQWLVYNMLGAVQRSDDKRLKQIIARYARRLAKAQPYILPQLRPYLPHNPGESNGK